MGKLEEYFKITYSERFKKNYRIILCLLVISMMVLANLYWNRKNDSENDFLKALNLKLTLKVKAVKPTGNHGYGVIFGQLVNSNTSPNYLAAYQGKYTLCKIKNKNVLLVSAYYVVQANDSVIINSSLLKYWVYRKGVLMSEYNLTNTTDWFLYSDLEKNKYLDFDTYKDHH
jgi:hypothetical protein